MKRFSIFAVVSIMAAAALFAGCQSGPAPTPTPEPTPTPIPTPTPKLEIVHVEEDDLRVIESDDEGINQLFDLAYTTNHMSYWLNLKEAKGDVLFSRGRGEDATLTLSMTALEEETDPMTYSTAKAAETEATPEYVMDWTDQWGNKAKGVVMYTTPAGATRIDAAQSYYWTTMTHDGVCYAVEFKCEATGRYSPELIREFQRSFVATAVITPR